MQKVLNLPEVTGVELQDNQEEITRSKRAFVMPMEISRQACKG